MLKNKPLEKIAETAREGRQWIREKLRPFRESYPRLYLATKVAAIAGGSFTFLLFLLLTLVYWGAFGPLPTYPDLMSIRNYQASEVFSEDGVLLGKYYIENRIEADFEEITPAIIDALVATEDARFFEHSGIDFRAWARVLFKSVLLSDETAGGGSTLSQQLAKNLYPRRDYWLFSIFINKVREMFTARRLERIYTKDELLNLYLNTVPFGENVYGIKVAAQRFFNKSPEELRVEEAAVLVGMLKANTYYNPVRHYERALQRRNVVLYQMSKYGYLPPEQVDSLQQLPIDLQYEREGEHLGSAAYFREHLRRELEELLADHVKPDGAPYDLFTDGLKIYTTIDARLQRYAEQAVGERVAKLQEAFYKDWKKGFPWGDNPALERAVARSDRYRSLKAQGLSQEAIETVFKTPVPMRVFTWDGQEAEREMSPLDSVKHYLTLLHAGFLAAEPQTGLIRAWVGGINYGHFQYDHVKSRRQVGSTFKPVVFARALASGMMPCEYTENELVTYADYDNWQPRNSDNEYGGVYSMEGALSQSVNAVTVDVLMRTGIDSVRALARNLGLSGDIPRQPAIALGAVEASLWDMVQVYGAFANRGRRPEFHYLDRIETSDGQVLVAFDRPATDDFERVLDEGYADVVVKMLQSVVDSGTARRLRYEFGLYNPIAGKTGTTQNQTDGWFIGFTPHLVAGAWVGAENPQVHFRTMRAGQGSSTALPIVGDFMRRMYQDPAFKKKKWTPFTPPHDTLVALMQCPPYLEEMPIIADFRYDYSENPGFFERLFGRLERTEEGRLIHIPRPRPGETEAEFERRIWEREMELQEKEKRREERRQKAKAFWNKLLFDKEG